MYISHYHKYSFILHRDVTTTKCKDINIEAISTIVTLQYFEMYLTKLFKMCT